MATTVIRTPAEDLAAATEAMRSARAEFRNWAAHCDRMLSDPEDAAAIAWQARRSAKIIQALLDQAEVYLAAVPDCCKHHDGPHVHGCILRRTADGREHQGSCVTGLSEDQLRTEAGLSRTA